MEGAFAAVGSHAEDILDCIDQEVESGRSKPLDIEYYLAEVIPSILAQSGRSLKKIHDPLLNMGTP